MRITGLTIGSRDRLNYLLFITCSVHIAPRYNRFAVPVSDGLCESVFRAGVSVCSQPPEHDRDHGDVLLTVCYGRNGSFMQSHELEWVDGR